MIHVYTCDYSYSNHCKDYGRLNSQRTFSVHLTQLLTCAIDLVLFSSSCSSLIVPPADDLPLSEESLSSLMVLADPVRGSSAFFVLDAFVRGPPRATSRSCKVCFGVDVP